MKSEVVAAAPPFYRRAVELLTERGIPFLVGGAYAMGAYTGIVRDTRDFDIFLTRDACAQALEALAEAGYRTECPFPHWLGKAFHDDYYIDFIFSSGNGVCEVDASWFVRSPWVELFGFPVRFCAAEEIIWGKAFVMERERFDGADIAHLLRALAERLDWRHLLDRFGPHWRVLLAHLILFSFVYPGEMRRVPGWVMEELIGRLRANGVPAAGRRVCQGTLLSRSQYLVDIEAWGYEDARLLPRGTMTPEETALWTRAAKEQEGS